MIGGLCLFFTWLIVASLGVTLPDEKLPVLFYSNQARHDIKRIFYQALDRAQQSIFLSVYGITDPEILSLLSKKKVPVLVEYDPSASSDLKKILPSASVYPIKSRGLMHRKILILDDTQVFLGTANLTASSLRHHANLVLGLFSPALAAYLKDPLYSTFSTQIGGQTAEVYLLPDPQASGLSHLLHCIELANTSIKIAMFTLTHTEITDALIRASKRGVKVEVAVDYYTARGASKKTVARLEKQNINVLLSQGRELLHHKWALFDNTTLVMGSANWTKAAFSKNHDFLFFLSPLTPEQKKFLEKIWRVIELESLDSSL